MYIMHSSKKQNQILYNAVKLAQPSQKRASKQLKLADGNSNVKGTRYG